MLHVITTVTSVLALVAIAAPPALAQISRPAMRQLQTTPRVEMKALIRPALGNIVTNPDGSFVSDVDGRKRGFRLSPGSVHSIRGKGFGRRGNASTLLLKSIDGHYAGQLMIQRWDDDLIIAQVPTEQGGFPANGQWQLLILTAGGKSFTIEGARYNAAPIEVPLKIVATDDAAFVAAGIAPLRWYTGRESFTAEADGSATVYRNVAFAKGQRNTPCPGPGRERINIAKLQQGLRLAPGFEISRIVLSHGATDRQFTGRYNGAWEPDGSAFIVDWGVWRFRQDASFSMTKAFNPDRVEYGKHYSVKTDDSVFAVCASEYSLKISVTGPRGVAPR